MFKYKIECNGCKTVIVENVTNNTEVKIDDYHVVKIGDKTGHYCKKCIEKLQCQMSKLSSPAAAASQRAVKYFSEINEPGFSADDVDILVHMAHAGCTEDEIARVLSKSVDTVHQFITTHVYRPVFPNTDVDAREALLAMIKYRVTIPVMSFELRYSVKAILKELRDESWRYGFNFNELTNADRAAIIELIHGGCSLEEAAKRVGNYYPELIRAYCL